MIRCYLSGNPVHDRVIRAFAEGCKGELVEGWKYEPSKVAVVFGIRKSKVPVSWPRGEVISQQRKNNHDVVVLETGYINRGDGENHHYAAGWNGLNGRADFRNEDVPGDRWRKLGVEMKPWREDGSHILLCGQVPWDASVDHIDYLSWLRAMPDKVRRYTSRPIVFRPHPLARIDLDGVEQSKGLSLESDLQNCWAVMTFNSNSSVEAVIAGIPAFTFDDGSMSRSVTDDRLDRVEYPRITKRGIWVRALAYCQWTLDEMRSGEAWEHLSL